MTAAAFLIPIFAFACAAAVLVATMIMEIIHHDD